MRRRKWPNKPQLINMQTWKEAVARLGQRRRVASLELRAFLASSVCLSEASHPRRMYYDLMFLCRIAFSGKPSPRRSNGLLICRHMLLFIIFTVCIVKKTMAMARERLRGGKPYCAIFLLSLFYARCCSANSLSTYRIKVASVQLHYLIFKIVIVLSFYYAHTKKVVFVLWKYYNYWLITLILCCYILLLWAIVKKMDKIVIWESGPCFLPTVLYNYSLLWPCFEKIFL